MASYSFNMTIDDEDYDVEFVYYPPMRGSRGQYGEPLEPDDPEDVEISSVINDDEVDVFEWMYPRYGAVIEEAAWEFVEQLKRGEYNDC